MCLTIHYNTFSKQRLFQTWACFVNFWSWAFQLHFLPEWSGFLKMHVACWVPKDRVSWHNFPKINERVDTLFWHSRVFSDLELVTTGLMHTCTGSSSWYPQLPAVANRETKQRSIYFRHAQYWHHWERPSGQIQPHWTLNYMVRGRSWTEPLNLLNYPRLGFSL